MEGGSRLLVDEEGDSPLEDVVLETYPTSPPIISVSTRYPHANIVEEAGRITLCLDMLETPSAKNKPTPYSGWSSAMCAYASQRHRAGFTGLAGNQGRWARWAGMEVAERER